MLSLPPEKLKELLIKENLIDTDTFDALHEESIRKRQNMSEMIISRGFITADYFYTILSKFLNIEKANLYAHKIDEKILHLLPEDLARRRRVIVFNKEPNGIFNVAMENPVDLETVDFLSLRLGGTINPYLATDEELNNGFSLYGKSLTQDFKDIIEKRIKESLLAKVRGDLKEEGEDMPIVGIVDAFLSYAVSSRASDVHFEILDDIILVRFRIDGVLHEIVKAPKEIHPAIIARFKILSGLRIDEHNRSQDGRFRHKIENETIDIRVSILPTFYGEKVELRLLSAAQKPLSLAELGMSENSIKSVLETIHKSYGMVLICGPTGCGKTTTLYSIMNILNKPDVNIVTIEDPIEYDMRYINQVQVNLVAGITFAAGLKSILRQDPNIIMVGEIRDNDTANISVQSALTGHLVLSSLHTNDAITAIPRLIDMGIPPFLVAVVLNSVIAQRLTRKIHIGCIESYEVDESSLETIKAQIQNMGLEPKSIKLPKRFYRGKGCSVCDNTGYFGRIGIYEILNIKETARTLIVNQDFNLDNLRILARKEGMVSMFEDGLQKVELGLTTLEELFRVIRE